MTNRADAVAAATTFLLTIVTVVFDDEAGLLRTLESVRGRAGGDVQHVVVDGGPPAPAVDALLPDRFPDVELRREPDDGLYDAMNKGLRRADGDYVLFLNAGDELDPDFTTEPLRDAGGSGKVLIGYSIESWGTDHFLRPGLGREHEALRMPAHQATFYPRAWYARHEYDATRFVDADGLYTAAAVRALGAVFVPVVVCRFALGGRSSSYGDRALVRRRLAETVHPIGRLRLVAKSILWRVVPRPFFYRALAFRKYTRFVGGAAPRTAASTIELR